jgi:hypothetical protein
MFRPEGPERGADVNQAQMELMAVFLPSARRVAEAIAPPGVPRADVRQEAMLATAETVQLETGGTIEVGIAIGVRLAKRLADLEAGLASGRREPLAAGLAARRRGDRGCSGSALYAEGR